MSGEGEVSLPLDHNKGPLGVLRSQVSLLLDHDGELLGVLKGSGIVATGP
jgi:hypothetical protein